MMGDKTRTYRVDAAARLGASEPFLQMNLGHCIMRPRTLAHNLAWHGTSTSGMSDANALGFGGRDEIA
jgi:hypothetical protein